MCNGTRRKLYCLANNMIHSFHFVFLYSVPNVDFLVKIEDVRAEEREDAVFECLLSQPLKKITWKGKNIPLEQGEKFDILVSDDMLIHTLVVKDCFPLDKGIYAAVAGMASCSAWLVVDGEYCMFLNASFKAQTEN